MSFRDRMLARAPVEAKPTPFTGLRVAVVLAGQPRTWRACLPWWTDVFKDRGDVQYDVFAHIWDYDSIGHGEGAKTQPIPRSEIDDLIGFIKPKAFLVEGAEVDPRGRLRMMRRPDENQPSAVAWQASQFYSVMRAAHLKREYELDHGFEYDVCMKGRFDIVFPEAHRMTNAPLPARHSLYVTHAYHDQDFRRQRTGDIFYYGDSPSFDIAAGFYRHLNRFTRVDYSLEGTMMPPEMPFHDFIRINGMSEHALPWGPGPRLKRPPEYAEVLAREGRDLGAHEVF